MVCADGAHWRSPASGDADSAYNFTQTLRSSV
ncbi:hypothetical protein PCA20602_04996 [Pandoraea capi]|uniref:Transposase n=1 Tax=Pandoraea capi TaxID=2508286 RepID=A0ABY6WC58_9BURK|nr:hypothetical protein PCA20602_04996 [Pandoraea capi]